MRVTLIQAIKSEIEANLKDYLREEGIELTIAANDNTPLSKSPTVALEAIEDRPLEDCALLSEIKVILGILGKPWQCEALIKGIYEALHPHHITHSELAILLTSLHVEAMHCVRPRHLKKRAIVRYVVEETSQVANDSAETPERTASNAEFC